MSQPYQAKAGDQPIVILDIPTCQLLIQVAKDAAAKVDIRGYLCPECGRNNSDYGCVCTADDCPGVMALEAAKTEIPT